MESKRAVLLDDSSKVSVWIVGGGYIAGRERLLSGDQSVSVGEESSTMIVGDRSSEIVPTTVGDRYVVPAVCGVGRPIEVTDP